MSEQYQNPIDNREKNRGKHYTSYTHIHDRSFSCLGTGTSIKKQSGGVKHLKFVASSLHYWIHLSNPYSRVTHIQ
jgi:hypothetical protein